jgi:hypothetical protein
LSYFRHMVGLLGRVISPSQGLYLHSTTQHRKTWTNIHALSGIRTHDPSNQPAKTHASNLTTTVTGSLSPPPPLSLSLYIYIYTHGYSKISIHFQEFILQVLLNIRRRAIYRLKGELSKLFSHLTSTRCEPHV